MDQVSDFLSNCSTLRVQNIMQSNINCNYIKEIKEPSYATSSYRLPEKVSMNYQGQNSPVLVKQEFPCKDIVKKIKSEDEIFYLVRSCMTTPKPAESQQFVTQYALMNTNEPNRSHLPVINNVVNFAECHQALQQDIRSNEQVQRQLYPINELYIPSVRDVPEKQFYLHEISPGLLQELNLHQRQQIVENQLIISQVQPESPQGSRDMLLVDELKRAEVQIVQNGICSKTSLPKSVKIHNSGIEEQSVCDPFSVYSANSVQLPLLNKANETTSNEISSGIEKHISSEHEVIDLYSPEEEVLSVNDSDSDVEVIHDNTNDWVDNITSVDHVLSEGAEDINTPMYQNNLKATVMLPDVLLERVEIATKSEREKRVIRKTRKVPVETNQLENVLVPTQIKRPRRRPRKVIDENEKTGQQEIVKKTKEHKRQLRNKTDENDKNGQVSKTEESKRVLRNKRKASDDSKKSNYKEEEYTNPILTLETPRYKSVLEMTYTENKFPDAETCRKLAKKIRKSSVYVDKWFERRRSQHAKELLAVTKPKEADDSNQRITSVISKEKSNVESADVLNKSSDKNKRVTVVLEMSINDVNNLLNSRWLKGKKAPLKLKPLQSILKQREITAPTEKSVQELLIKSIKSNYDEKVAKKVLPLSKHKSVVEVSSKDDIGTTLEKNRKIVNEGQLFRHNGNRSHKSEPMELRDFHIFTPEKERVLECAFRQAIYPDRITYKKLSQELKLPLCVVRSWFHRKREIA